MAVVTDEASDAAAIAGGVVTGTAFRLSVREGYRRMALRKTSDSCCCCWATICRCWAVP
jgi:hypothetical protein